MKHNYKYVNFSILPLIALLISCNGQSEKINIVTPQPFNKTHNASFILTTTDRLNLLSEKPQIAPSNKADFENIIKIDASIQYQSFIGAGAAITDASAIVLQKNLNSNKKNDILNELFGLDGLNLSFTRLTIGASDFSANHYSLNEMPKGETDIDLKNFKLDAMPSEILPTIKQAKQINPKLSIMASPWSAPNWMKTTDNMIGGSLRPEFYNSFAKYFVKYNDEMRKNGINIDYISIQNEPHFSPANYPGMNLSPKMRADFIKNHLGPQFEKIVNAPKILEWDHNWDEPNAPKEVLADKDANKYINGVAWHCYAGNVSAQTDVKKEYPDKDVYFTECSGGEWAKDWNKAFPWQMENLIIGTTRNWARGILLWNLALDENFGPHLGGCGDCRGVITINSKNGEITRNLEYYALGHISKYVKIGAKRIESDLGKNGIINVAFQNPDKTIVIIVLNNSEILQSFSLLIGEKYYNMQLQNGAAATLIIK